MLRDSLAGVNKEVFERVWAIAVELNAMERHFNEMQSRYRSLASAWLLAAFGGIGFVLSEKVPPAVDREPLVLGLSLAGAVGIFLLWLIDLLVYHEMLVAGYGEGRDLEREFPWLPQRRARISDALTGRPVRMTLVWFYISGIEILLLIGCAAFYFWKRFEGLLVLLGGLAALVALAVFVGLFIHRTTFKRWLAKPRRWREVSTTPEAT